jgi:hypothetical protein
MSTAEPGFFPGAGALAAAILSLGNLAPIEFERRSQKNRITEPEVLNL